MDPFINTIPAKYPAEIDQNSRTVGELAYHTKKYLNYGCRKRKSTAIFCVNLCILQQPSTLHRQHTTEGLPKSLSVFFYQVLLLNLSALLHFAPCPIQRFLIGFLIAADSYIIPFASFQLCKRIGSFRHLLGFQILLEVLCRAHLNLIP